MKKFLFLFMALLLSSSAFANYDFIINNRNISYNEDELKFYENNKLLDENEVRELFPDYDIVLISDFDKNKKYYMKNSLFKSKKILLLNDTRRTFHLFYIYPISSRNQINSDDKDYKVKSLITVYGKKNVRLKDFGLDEFEIVVK